MISHGAITVINAIPCGIGATVGIDLLTSSEFVVSGTERSVRIANDPGEDTNMARICVKNTFLHFGIEEPEGWSLTVDSQIPVSRGLKSSSSACNSIVSSVTEWISKEHGKRFEGRDGTIEMIRLGVRCAREANVTVTGSFDDACGCHLGGLVITDNGKDEIMMRADVDVKDVILLVPEMKIRKPSLDKDRFYTFASVSSEIAELAKKDWCSALTKNGALVAKALGIDDTMSGKAVSMGALAAGMSGTGPAISIVVEKNCGASFLKDLEHNGYDAIITRTR
jgi:shikimate kinase